MKNLDISIIIVSWNTREFLRQCLSSVYKTIHNVQFEVLVADNNSSDGSPEMVRKEFPQTKLICTGKNLGFARANNICIKKSKSRYLCLINSDVELMDNSIKKMHSYMEKHHDVGILGPKVLNPDGTLQKSNRNFPSYLNVFLRALALDTIFSKSRLFVNLCAQFLPYNHPHSVEVLLGSFWFIRSAALNDVGLLDESFFMYGEDIDWCKRFILARWKVIYFPESKIIHYLGGSSQNVPIKSYIELKRSSLLYWKKYHGRFGILYVSIIMLVHEIVRIIGDIILCIIKTSDRKELGHKIYRSMACISWLLSISRHKRN